MSEVSQHQCSKLVSVWQSTNAKPYSAIAPKWLREWRRTTSLVCGQSPRGRLIAHTESAGRQHLYPNEQGARADNCSGNTECAITSIPSRWGPDVTAQSKIPSTRQPGTPGVQLSPPPEKGSDVPGHPATLGSLQWILHRKA